MILFPYFKIDTTEQIKFFYQMSFIPQSLKKLSFCVEKMITKVKIIMNFD